MRGAFCPADLDSLLGTLHPAPDSVIRSERYDFRHPELLSRDQNRTLRNVHERFAEAIAKKLSNELLTNLSVTLVSIDARTYAEFLELLPNSAVFSVIAVPELAGNIALTMDPAIAFAFIDRLLGGTGSSLTKVRPLTVIEQGLMSRIVSKCCAELTAAWSSILPLSFQLKSMERNPELAGVVEGNEMVLLVRLHIHMNDVSGTMNLGLPAVVMEPALPRLGPSTAGARPDAPPAAPATARPALERSLEACAIRLDVDLAEVEVSFGELLQLRSGDVLTFAPNTESGAAASLEGAACLEGKPGRSRGHWAFQVISKVLDGARAEGNPA